MGDGASKGLVLALSSENFQLSKDKCTYVEKWEGTLKRKFCPSQSPFLGTSLTSISVPSAICQGALVEKGRVWQNGPSCTFWGAYSTYPSAVLFNPHHCWRVCVAYS